MATKQPRCTACGFNAQSWYGLAKHIMNQKDINHEEGKKWAKQYLEEHMTTGAHRYGYGGCGKPSDWWKSLKGTQINSLCRVCHKPYEDISGDLNKVCQC